MTINNKTLIILGMHRSGTSLTAQWLNACGLNLGDDLLGSDFSNKKGHFEDTDFLELNKEILKNNDLHKSGLRGNLANIKLTEYHKTKIKYICNLKSELHSQWGWKEPRTCLLIDEYVKNIHKPFVFVVYRELSEVRTSLIKRDITRMFEKTHLGFFTKVNYKIFKKQLHRKWAQILNNRYTEINIYYHKKIIDFIKKTDCNHLIVNQKYLINHSQMCIDKLNNWGFKLEDIPFNNIFDHNIHNVRENYLNPYVAMTADEELLYKELEEMKSFK